jgi:signal transduction histidine kinase
LIQQKNTQTKFLIFIIFIIIIFSAALFWLYRTQMKLSNVLTEKNKEISNQNEEIRQQKEELLSTNEKLAKAQEVIEEQNKSLAQYNQILEKRVDERTQEVAFLNKELESVSFELDNFIYKSSHDIRGPLVRLIGICNLALMEVNDKTSREYFTIFHGAVKHLCDLFDRLSLINYINSTEVQNSAIDFQKIVGNVKDRLKGAKNFEKVTIETNIDRRANIVSDSFLIETIFYNLIDNSVRFQNKCQVTEKRVRVSVSRQDHDVIISFTDNGIGIPKENISHIFNMFSKAALDHQTIGLGLYTVRQCLQKLKGSISLVGNKENLTEFEVRLKAKAELSSYSIG